MTTMVEAKGNDAAAASATAVATALCYQGILKVSCKAAVVKITNDIITHITTKCRTTERGAQGHRNTNILFVFI